MNAPLAMTIFAFSKTQVVKYIAVAQLLRSMLAFITYASYIKFNLGKILNNRIISISALCGLLLFHLTSYSWPFLPGQIKMYTNYGMFHHFLKRQIKSLSNFFYTVLKFFKQLFQKLLQKF